MARPLSPETLAYDLMNASDPRVSPDGTCILYTLRSFDPVTRRGRSQLWLCTIEGGAPRWLTPEGWRAGTGRWSPTGEQIAFTLAHERGTSIWVMAANQAGGMREVTRHAHEVADLAWSPDGQRLAYTTLFDPENPEELEWPADVPPKVRVTRRIDYKQDGRGFVGDVRSQVFVIDVASGVRRRITTELVDHQAPQWSPDGQWIGVQLSRQAGPGSQLVLLNVDSGASQTIGPDDCMIAQEAWSPDGDRIIYAGDPAPHTFQPDFFVCDVAGDKTHRLTDDLASMPADQPIWLDERRVLVHAMRAGASQLEIIDAATGEMELVRRWEARHSGLSIDRAGRYIVQAQMSLSSFGEITVYDRETATDQVITAYNSPVLADHLPAKWERFEVPRGEFTIEAWLLKPADFDPTRRYPVILDVHGGPNGNYGYGFLAHQQCFATHGFLVVYPNARGSTSYGRRFAQQVLGDWGGEDCRDLMAALDAVLERPYADPERTGIFGISYGGYMTAWVISQTDRFKAAICGEPFFDLESAYGTSMNGHRGIERHAGGPPHERREWYATHSPSTYAHQTRTPTLIIQGEADETCPLGQSEQMFVALKKAGCEVEFARYPGGSHMFFVYGPPEHRVDFLTRTLGWFKDHLGEPV